jgi:hypothetical protein
VTDEGNEPLTPEEEAAVTRMLADAAGPEPMPADVSARLLELIDELEADRLPSEVPGGEVVALRRRRWPRLMLAAAAVLVVGYGVGSVALDGSLSGSDAGSADSAAAGSGASTDTAESESQVDKERLGPSPQEGSYSALQGGSRPVRLHSERLDAGVRRALRVLAVQDSNDALLRDSESRGCEAPELGKGEQSLPVRYDGHPAVLVTHPAGDDLVEVTVYSCAGAELDGTTVEP